MSSVCIGLAQLHLIFMTLSPGQAFNSADLRQLSEDIDSMFKSINAGVETFMEYVGDEDGCIFRCKDGSTPRRNPDHEPSYNGCGPVGLEINIKFLPGVTRCCNEHDICYDTCNKSKDQCDSRFKSCLEKICDDSKHLMKNEVNKSCKNMASLMYTGTMALGCKSYRDAQKNACLCDQPALRQKKSSKRDDL